MPGGSRLRPDNLGALSGNAYLVMQDRKPEGQLGNRPFRIPIKHPNNCDHGFTVCSGTPVDSKSGCAESWGWDHRILWDRTAGGRRLKQQLNIS